MNLLGFLFGRPPGIRDGTSRIQELASPETEYAFRFAKYTQQLERTRVHHGRLWAFLIGVLFLSFALSYFVFSSRISPLWIAPAVMPVSAMVESLRRNGSAYRERERIVNFYEGGIQRLQGRWQGKGMNGEEYAPTQHQYAADLDLFGEGSVFELLCSARTSIGRAKLAAWLLDPAEIHEIRARQLAVAELRDKLDLRQSWASMGEDAIGGAGSASLYEWASGPCDTFPRYAKVSAVFLPLLLIAVGISIPMGFFIKHWMYALGVMMIFEATVALSVIKPARQLAASIALPSFELSTIVPLLRRFEGEHFESVLLRSLQFCLRRGSCCASKQIRKLRVLVWLLELRRFEYFALIASFVLWGTNLAILIERWRQQNLPSLPGWLDSLGAFEALLCLARHAYENPNDVFPNVITERSPLFKAEGLGHPLLDRKKCVTADIALEKEGMQLLMVSGSNMSGKSTFLRSVGTNAVLALAGAPVRATRLHISGFWVGCSIGVQDSLLDSKSRFQAEVERLKWIIESSQQGNVLFLLDEVLGGTNSNDRFFGVRAITDSLIRNGAIGIITTHDLALTTLPETFAERAANVHFEEHYVEGEMRFDYRMRPGVPTRTNGLSVMAALGLLSCARE